MLKLCSKCGHVKNNKSFYENRLEPDGRHPICKTCVDNGIRIERSINKAMNRGTYHTFETTDFPENRIVLYENLLLVNNLDVKIILALMSIGNKYVGTRESFYNYARVSYQSSYIYERRLKKQNIMKVEKIKSALAGGTGFVKITLNINLLKSKSFKQKYNKLVKPNQEDETNVYSETSEISV